MGRGVARVDRGRAETENCRGREGSRQPVTKSAAAVGRSAGVPGTEAHKQRHGFVVGTSGSRTCRPPARAPPRSASAALWPARPSSLGPKEPQRCSQCQYDGATLLIGGEGQTSSGAGEESPPNRPCPFEVTPKPRRAAAQLRRAEQRPAREASGSGRRSDHAGSKNMRTGDRASRGA